MSPALSCHDGRPGCSACSSTARSASRAYLASYWLRFQGERLEAFLPGAWSTLPLVVAGQLVALGAGRRLCAAAAHRLAVPGRSPASCVGTAASSALVGVAIGFEGVSRMAFVADAHAVVDCRRRLARRLGARHAGAGARRAAAARRSGRSRRGDDDARRGRDQPLQLPRAAEEPGPQGPQAEVPRLGVRLPVVAGQSAADDHRLHGRVHLHPARPQRGVRLLPDARPAVVDVLRQLGRRCPPARSSTTPAC